MGILHTSRTLVGRGRAMHRQSVLFDLGPRTQTDAPRATTTITPAHATTPTYYCNRNPRQSIAGVR
eukprot:11185369-Lingulodinium_polyedra.AAC.1